MDKAKCRKIVKKFGRELCVEAYALHHRGEGAFMIAEFFGITDKLGRVNVRRADNIIDAGRYLYLEEVS